MSDQNGRLKKWSRELIRREELHIEILDLLACPICRKGLSFEGSRSDSRFVNGVLKCPDNHSYQIKQEIAILKDPKTSEEEFEWKIDVADEKKYDEIRKEYDSYFNRDQTSAMQRMKEQLNKHVIDSCLKSHNTVLDIATGMGTFLLPLAENIPANALVLGTDIDEKPLRGTMIKAKRAQSYSKISLIAANAKRLCFKNSSISLVSSYFGFDNIPETVIALKESARVLQREGRAIFASLWYREDSESMRIAEKHKVSQIASRARLEKALEEAGLVLDHVEEIYTGVWLYNPMDLLPVEGDEYSHVIVTAKKA